MDFSSCGTAHTRNLIRGMEYLRKKRNKTLKDVEVTKPPKDWMAEGIIDLVRVFGTGENCGVECVSVPDTTIKNENQARRYLLAMKKNHRLRKVSVAYEVSGDHERMISLKKSIEMWEKLNRNGRHYLLEDEEDRSKGVEVIASVIDDIDCLYSHLREHPKLLPASINAEG